MEESPMPSTAVAVLQNQSSVVVEWLRFKAQFEDPSVTEEVKLRCLQEIMKNLDRILSHPVSQKCFLESGIPSFITTLERMKPNFENTARHQCRKMIIEIFRRLAAYKRTNNVPLLHPYQHQVSQILSLMFKTTEVDNEENVISSLRVIFILHIQLQARAVEETKSLLRWIRAAFLNVQVKPGALYGHKNVIESTEISNDEGLLRLLDNTFTVTPIISKEEEGRTLIPKGMNSLKVLHELLIRTFRFHQMYKELIQPEVVQLIPVIISILALHPTESQRESSQHQFNKKIYLELISVQLKTLSLIGYLMKDQPFQQSILEHSELIAAGYINILKFCPPAVVPIRLEALRAMLPLLKSPLVLKFLPYVSQLFDTDLELLLGKGWTSNKNQEVRRSAYKLVIELACHSKQQLSVEDLIRVINFFAVQLLDDTNTFGIQATFVKLAVLLVGIVLQKLSPEKKEEGREVLFRLLEIYASKLKRVCLTHLPRWLVVDKDSVEAPPPPGFELKAALEMKPNGHTLLECQGLVTQLVVNVKSIGWLIYGKKTEGTQSQNQVRYLPLKQFSPEEVDIYVEVMKWGVKAMGIFTGEPSLNQNKQLWLDFCLIFGSLNPDVFHQICSSTIEVVVEEISQNPGMKQLANRFLEEKSTSSIFSSVMLQFLLEKMDVLGSESGERRELYLNLFRMIFVASRKFPMENELMLQPFFPQIINKAMEFGKSSKEPLIYFQLLLDLFNTLCWEKFEVLHQEFLTLLPNFIRDLVRIRGGLLPQEWDNLVIKLSLDFPARLSNLGPYLPTLMECLRAALNSSTSPFLVSLGLRKLEFLVENMPTQFNTEVMTHALAELVQALWKIVQDSDPSSNNGMSAFRILGKLGGLTRKTMVEPQKLKYLDAALTQLISSDTDIKYKKECWQLLKGVVLLSLSIKGETDRFCSLRQKKDHDNLTKTGIEGILPSVDGSSEKHLQVFEKALKGWLIGATIKEIKNDVLYCLAPTLRRIAIIMSAQYLSSPILSTLSNMYIAFDTIVNAFASEERELRKVALYSLSVLLKSLIQLMQSKDNAFASPMVDYFTEKMCCLFYDATWKGKMGGCEALSFLLENENAPLSWIAANYLQILRALFFLLKDICGQVSGGVVDIAKANLTKVIEGVCKDISIRCSPCSGDLSLELIKRVTSPSPLVREESLRGLHLVANLLGKTISEIIQPHLPLILKEFNTSKSLLHHQSVQHQLGILDGLHFYLTSASNLISLSWNTKELQPFINELLALSEVDECELKKLVSYKSCSPAELELLQKGVLRVLSKITDLPTHENPKIIRVFLLKLGSSNLEVQKVAFESFRKLLESQSNLVSIAMQQDAVKNVWKQFCALATLGIRKPGDVAVAQHLCYISQLFPSVFSSKLLYKVIHILQKIIENTAVLLRKKPNPSVLHYQFDLWLKILECFSDRLLNNEPVENKEFSKILNNLIFLCLNAEKVFSFGKEGSPLRKPLTQLLLRHHQYAAYYLSFLLTPSRVPFFFNLIEETGADSVRSYLFNDPSALVKLLTLAVSKNGGIQDEQNREQARFIVVKALYILNNFDEEWIGGEKGKEVAYTLIKLWKSPEYQKELKSKPVPGMKLEASLRSRNWQEPMMIVKLLLSFHKKNQDDYELLFRLVRPFGWEKNRLDFGFEFPNQFFQKEMTSYSTTWKRQAILEFIKFYEDQNVEEEVKARVIQAVLIPSLNSAFEKNEGEELLRGSSSQMGDNASNEEENLAHLLISQILSLNENKKLGDELNIALLQLWLLLVNQAPSIFVDNPEILKNIQVSAVPFASPQGMDIDPCVKYHAFILLAHLITRFKKAGQITLFTELIKASEVPEEAKGLVDEALKIIIPATLKIDDGQGNIQLYLETAKFLHHDPQAGPSTFIQLAHILKVIVQHWKSYYGGRHLLLESGGLLPTLQSLYSCSSSEDHKMLVLNVAETIFKWEKMGLELQKNEDETATNIAENKPLNPICIQRLLLFLFHFACQGGPPNAEVAKRSKNLLYLVLSLELWQNHLNFVEFGWMIKVLHPGYLYCSLALEILTFAIGFMSKEAVLRNMGVLQQGIILCININITSNPAHVPNPDGKGILAAVLNLLEKLMSLFPPNVTSYDELKPIYDVVFNGIYNSFKTFEVVAVNHDNFLSGVMMLKVVCESSDSIYEEQLMILFMNCLEKLSKQIPQKSTSVPTGPAETTPPSDSTVIFALKFIKPKVAFLTEAMLSTLITSLVDFLGKSNNNEILECIIEMVQDWAVDKNHEELIKPEGMHCLILKIAEMESKLQARNVKGREELSKLFLRLVLTVYQEGKFEGKELRGHLSFSFFRGMSHSQTEMREKFFDVYEASINRHVYDRLLHILSYQNWAFLGTQSWIKACVHLMFATVHGFTEEEEEGQHSNVELGDQNQDGFIVERLEEPDSQAIVGVKACKDDEFTRILETFNVVKMVVKPTIKLCHVDSQLAESVWISLLPKLWQELSPQRSLSLANEVPHFLMSGCHNLQQLSVSSALATFFEALCQCSPAIPLPPSVLYHLGKTHNLWHRSALLLEKLVVDFEGEGKGIPAELRDSLSELYSGLGEDDLWAALWGRAALLPETKDAVNLEQQGGSYEKAQEMLERAMNKMMLMNGTSDNADIAQIGEARLLEENWLKCTKELNEWDIIQDYTRTAAGSNPLMHLESLWRKRDWESSDKIFPSLNLNDYPGEYQWSIDLIRGYNILCSGKEKQTQAWEDLKVIANRAQNICAREWRALPKIVGGGAHVRVLQAAQRVVELREATTIHRSLLANQFIEVEQIVKAWEARRPAISDNLCHWADILHWRTLNYHFVVNYLTKQRDEAAVKDEKAVEIANRKLFGVHAVMQQALCQYGKVARKHGLPQVALEALELIYEFPKVPVNDCLQKLKQQFKCYMSEGKLENGRKLLEQTNLGYFGKDALSEFLTLKGRLLVKMGEGEEGNKAFSASCQLNSDKVGRNWAHWAEYLESCFIQTGRQMETGVSAVTAFLRACQQKNEVNSRKYIAKVLWLLEYDDEKGTLAASVNESSEQIPPTHWLVWIPQLLTIVTEKEGDGREMGTNILNRVGSLYAQAIVYPLRALYLALKFEEIAKSKLKNEESTTIKATPSMLQCSKIMQFHADSHPALVTTLEKVAEELTFSRGEGRTEKLLKELRNTLARCYQIAFENRALLAPDPSSTSVVVQQLRQILFGFHVPMKLAQEPKFLSMKAEFQDDFGSLISGKLNLVVAMQKIVKWIRILEEKTNKMDTVFICQDRCKFLSNFSMDIADMKLPGEFLIPKPNQCFVSIARFEPKVDVIFKRGLHARRLFIRGHNGKVYPYLVTCNLEGDYGFWEKEKGKERFLQLLRMLNDYFGKQKETAKRNMRFVVPKLVAVSSQLRLVEDNPDSLSLLEVFRGHCSKKKLDCDTPVLSYYEKVGDIQRKGDQVNGEALRRIFGDIQKSFSPRDVMANCTHFNYLTPSDYWMFRKTFTTQVCLKNVAEYAFQGGSVYPEQLNIHKDTGLVNISCFFDVDTLTNGDAPNFNESQVPFRLTPNLREILTDFGVTGPLVYGMMAVAKCLTYPNYKLDAILRLILKDEMITYVKMKKGRIGNQGSANGDEDKGKLLETWGSETVINLVNNAVSGIMARLGGLSVANGTESKVRSLVEAACNDDILCQMDPTWHPWL
ncbi:unnamed protein product [Orchesella dallaii]|uniref:Non-specific serine/threonine protein kinase n=1 Tax=Orchesella dallaii TaxID=48710 RepID=A0ABP1QVP2_9HEXA